MIVISLVLVTALIGLGTAILGFLNRKKIDQVHVLVNSQLHTVLERVEQLTESMREQGATVPDSPGSRPNGSGEVQ
jgi:hypothetical protein